MLIVIKGHVNFYLVGICRIEERGILVIRIEDRFPLFYGRIIKWKANGKGNRQKFGANFSTTKDVFRKVIDVTVWPRLKKLQRYTLESAQYPNISTLIQSSAELAKEKLCHTTYDHGPTRKPPICSQSRNLHQGVQGISRKRYR